MPSTSHSPITGGTATLPARPVARPSAGTPAPPDPQNLPLPPPQIFDILPPLHTLLSKLLPSSPDAQPVLDPQHLAVEATSIKLRIQKARAAVEGLNDLDRGIDEQEEEIRTLEERCEKQREVLRGLVEVLKAGSPTTAMELD